MDSESKGNIYVRDNELCILKNVYKLGIATFAKNRDDTYVTYEHKRGEFVMVIEIPLEKMGLADKYLKQYLLHHNRYIDAGTEYYDRCIIYEIEPFLSKTIIPYRILSRKEIDNLERRERKKQVEQIIKSKVGGSLALVTIKAIFNRLNIKAITQKYRNKRAARRYVKKENNDPAAKENNDQYPDIQIDQPLVQQQHVLDMIKDFYYANDIGKLIWACGLGKALLSIMIVGLLGFRSIVFGVPSNNLQNQIKKEILRIFPNKDNILFIGGDDDTKPVKSKERRVTAFLARITNDAPKFVITTYHSCYLLVSDDIAFDFKIGDEAHHLVGREREEEKGFRLFHKIKASKSLFMTATEKTLETSLRAEKTLETSLRAEKTLETGVIAPVDKILYSMDDEAIFGKYIDIKTVNWAIENKKITDYNILVLKNNEYEVDRIIRNLKINVINKELFISCYMSLKSFEKYDKLTHLLLYTNTTEDADIAKKYIDDILASGIITIAPNDVYNNALHSKHRRDLAAEVTAFKNAKYGIISCVYIFGEGFDLPKLNGVCIAATMKSETRIVQYIMRANRLEKGNPDKIAYVILPYIDMNDCSMRTPATIENKSYEKIRLVIVHLRNVDESIEQKIQVMTGQKTNRKIRVNDWLCYEDYDFEENGEELNKIKLRLRYSKALGSDNSEEQDEYNYVRAINTSLNIQSMIEYNSARDTHEHFIESPEEYFKLKGVWVSWYDFMGINTAHFIQDKNEWVQFCRAKNIKSLDEYNKACEIYNVLPKEPKEFYKELDNLMAELSLNYRRRR